MPRKRSGQTSRKGSGQTLLELCGKRQDDNSARRDSIEKQTDEEKKEEVFGKGPEMNPIITKLHKQAQKKFESTKDKGGEGPPLVHMYFQYCEAVTQTRYEKSVFSAILHEADNIVDKVTGDEDDSDFETLIEVGDESSNIVDGLGLGKTKAMPELRILITKVSNANRICEEEIKHGKLAVIHQCGTKEVKEKSRMKTPNYRHAIGFNHVFSFRGKPIEHWYESEIKIEVKVYTESDTHLAYVLLSPQQSVFGEQTDERLSDKVVMSPLFWREYLDSRTEEMRTFTVPLVCPGVRMQQRIEEPLKKLNISPPKTPTPPSSSKSSSSSPAKVSTTSSDSKTASSSTSEDELDEPSKSQEMPVRSQDAEYVTKTPKRHKKKSSVPILKKLFS